MQLQDITPEPWYEKSWLAVLLCMIFFPVGLYALWKNSKIHLLWKFTITGIIALIIIANFGVNDKKPAVVNTPVEHQEKEIIQPSESEVQQQQLDNEKSEVIAKLKAKAARDWPDDYSTQEFWVNQEIEDYEYMKGIEDNSIKRKAQHDWPLDFTTQKFWYNEQIDARERMGN